MPWVAAVAGVAGAAISSSGASDAAQTQADATNAGTAEQRRQADRAYADQAPYRAAGSTALGQLATENNAPTTAADVMSDPGYQFGLDQGQLGLDRKAAASGGRVSGAALKSASSYATNYAASGYSAAYQRKQDRLNRLAAIAGIGQTSTQASAASGQNSANAITGLLSSQGNATGASQIAQSNIWGNAINQLGAAGQRYVQNQPSYTPAQQTDLNNFRSSSFNNADNYG